MSLEHVYPEWLGGVLPEQERWRGQDTAVAYGAGATFEGASVATREMGQRFNETTVKRVCRACNHGWMNGLEESVRPTLGPMIRGDMCEVDAESCGLLAVWVAKTTLMAEFTHPESNATPPEHYRWLYEKREPPPLMRLWSFPIDGDDWAVRMQHIGVLYGGVSVEPSQPCNAHSTMIGLGQTAFLSIGTTNERLPMPPIEKCIPRSVVRLWPSPTAFSWHREAPVDDEAAWLMSDMLRLWIADDDEELFSRLLALQTYQ